MKNFTIKQSNLVRLLAVCISVFSLIYIVSCSSFLKQENTPSLRQYAVQIDHTGLDVVNLTSQEVKEGNFASNKFKLSQTRADVSNESAKILIDKLQSYFKNFAVPVDEAPKYITVYTTGPMKDIQLSEIKGVSLFTFKDEKLRHYFYIANGKNLSEDKRFAVTTDYFYTSEMHLIGNAIFKNSSIKWTMFAISAPSNARLSTPSFTVASKTNNLSNAIIKVSGIKLEGEALLSDGCGSCGSGYGNCTQDSGGWWCCESCDGDICNLKSINNNGSSLGLTLDLELAYSFKDDFMKKTDVGNKYISYYYLLSKVAFENKEITSETVGDYFDFATKVYSSAKVMQFGDDDDVVCNSTFQKQALTFVKKYRSFSDDNSYQEALSTIEKDLNKFSGKTKAYIKENWK